MPKDKALRPALRLMIGDKEYRAIGHAAAQWALFEIQLDFVISVLTQQPSTRDLGTQLPQSFKRRMRVLRSAAKIALAEHPKSLSELLKIASEASSLRGLRDDIIHGQWKLHRRSSKASTTTGVRVFSWGKIREVAFSAERVESVAAEISHAHLELVMWSQRNFP